MAELLPTPPGTPTAATASSPPRAPVAFTAGADAFAGATLQVGSLVDVFCNSQSCWCAGIVLQRLCGAAGDELLLVQFWDVAGNAKQKIMPPGNQGLALLSERRGQQAPPGFVLRPASDSGNLSATPACVDLTTGMEVESYEMAWQVYIGRLLLPQPPSATASITTPADEKEASSGDEQTSLEVSPMAKVGVAEDDGPWDAEGGVVDLYWSKGGWRVGLVVRSQRRPQDGIECCVVFFLGHEGRPKWKLVSRGDSAVMAPFGTYSGKELPPLCVTRPSASRPGAQSYLDTVTGLKYASPALAWVAYLRRAMAEDAAQPCGGSLVALAAAGGTPVSPSSHGGAATAEAAVAALLSPVHGLGSFGAGSPTSSAPCRLWSQVTDSEQRSPLRQPGGSLAASCLGGPFVEDFVVGPGPLDLARPQVLQQLQARLGCSSACRIEAHSNAGGQNYGVWFLADFVLKVVRCGRKFALLPSEVENVVRLQAEHPSIVDDPLVTFPIKVFNCVGHDGVALSILVMRRAPGVDLATFVGMELAYGRREQACRIFEEVGRSLRLFHTRYGGANHGDLHPSNIFVDEASGNISFIDVGGMDMATGDSDEQHFTKSCHITAELYGHDFLVESLQRFEAGYQSAHGQSCR